MSEDNIPKTVHVFINPDASPLRVDREVPERIDINTTTGETYCHYDWKDSQRFPNLIVALDQVRIPLDLNGLQMRAIERNDRNVVRWVDEARGQNRPYAWAMCLQARISEIENGIDVPELQRDLRPKKKTRSRQRC